MTTIEWGIIAGIAVILWLATLPLKRRTDARWREIYAEIDQILKEDPSMKNHSLLMSVPTFRKLIEKRRKVLTERK